MTLRRVVVGFVLAAGAAGMIASGVILGQRHRDQEHAARRHRALNEALARAMIFERCLLGTAWPAAPASDMEMGRRVGLRERSVEFVMSWICRRRVDDVREMLERVDSPEGREMLEHARAVITAMPAQPGTGAVRWRGVARETSALHRTLAAGARRERLRFDEDHAPVSTPMRRTDIRGLGTARHGDDITAFFQRVIDSQPTGQVVICRTLDGGHTGSCRAGDVAPNERVTDARLLANGAGPSSLYVERAQGSALVVSEDQRRIAVNPVDGDAVLVDGETAWTIESNPLRNGLAVFRTTAEPGATPRVIATVAEAFPNAMLVAVGREPWAAWITRGATPHVQVSLLGDTLTPASLGPTAQPAERQRPFLATCRTGTGAAFLAATGANRGVTVFRREPGGALPVPSDAGAVASAPAVAGWRVIGALDRGMRDVALRCTQNGAVVAFVEGQTLRAVRCAIAACGEAIELGERPAQTPIYAADDDTIMIVHPDGLVEGRELSGKIGSMTGGTGAPFWSVALEDDRSRGVSIGVIGRRGMLFLASGRDDTVDLWSGDVGAVSLAAGIVQMER